MIYYERDKFGNDEMCVVEEYSNLHYPYLHFHRNYEFIQLFGGKIEIALDDDKMVLEAGQFLLVHPNQVHAFTSLGNAHARVCIFSPKLVGDFYQKTLNLLPERTSVDFSQNSGEFLRKNLVAGADQFLFKSCIYLICSEMNRQTAYVSKTNPKDFALIHQIISYISQNYKDKISLRTAAEALGYNYQYLSNYLNKYRITFPDILNQHRLDYARYLLRNSDLSITNIAFECGYDNARTFNRNFLKLYELTPKMFRISDAN